VTAVRLAAIDATGLSLDALVVGLTGGKRETKVEIPPSSGLGTGERKRILDALRKLGVKPKVGEVIKLPGINGIEAPLIVCVPIGAPVEEVTPELLRRAAGAATMSINGVERVGIAMPCTIRRVAATAQGAVLGSYRFENFRVRVPTPVRGPKIVTS
jgi:leucyl aminopeptidase